MTKELEQPQIKENFKSTSNHYQEFLKHLGIDPEDFEDEFDIEIDDYAN
jgi:hypothetical protein